MTALMWLQSTILMNKYKTIDNPPREASLQHQLPQPFDSHRKADTTAFNNETEEHFLSSLTSDKRVVFIKLPKKPQPHTNSFRSSLYQSSLKRLKQQKGTLLKQTIMSRINPTKKSFQSFEEEALRRALKQSKQIKKQKKNSLPVVTKIFSESPRKKQASNYLGKQTFHEEPFHKLAGLETINTDKSTFEIDGSFLGFKNLKQKYLQLRQLSLNNKRKSQLLEKPHFRRHENEQDIIESYDSNFKMEKGIKDHMNRYSKKDFFQTKVNGYRTTIYPPEKAHHKFEEESKVRKRQIEDIRKQEHIENFVRKKKYSYLHSPRKQHQNGSFSSQTHYLRSIEEEPDRKKTKGGLNPEKISEKSEPCSPWNTENPSFDRF